MNIQDGEEVYCSGCAHYFGQTVTYGQCRKNAPEAKVGFPTVPYDCWCGEGKKKVKVHAD